MGGVSTLRALEPEPGPHDGFHLSISIWFIAITCCGAADRTQGFAHAVCMLSVPELCTPRPSHWDFSNDLIVMTEVRLAKWGKDTVPRTGLGTGEGQN